VRTRERHAAVQEQLAAGASISAIGRTLSLNRRTVRRFARAADVDQLLGKARSRGSLLDPFKPYLHERFNAGHTDAAALTDEIKALGYRGSDKTVRRYLQPFRETRTAPPAVPIPPTIRQVTGSLTRHPDSLNADDRMQLKQILVRSPELAATHRQVHDFAEIMTNRGHRLPAWMGEVDQHGEPALRSFVTGLRSDPDAVTNGLTLPYSSGPVEGAVNPWT
jgi:transposase